MQTEYDRRISDLESQSIQEKEQLAKEIQKLEQHLHLEKNRHQMLTQKFHQLEQSKPTMNDAILLYYMHCT